MSIVKITKSNFEAEVLNSNIPVVVDFWASWCGPCRAFAPTLEELAEENNNIKIGKVNVDEEGELAQQFGIMSIPTLIVFKNGQVTRKSIGIISKRDILKMI